MSPRSHSTALCDLRSEHGCCHRTAGHHGPCATFAVHPNLWFAWTAAGDLGYGHFEHGRFRVTRVGLAPGRILPGVSSVERQAVAFGQLLRWMLAQSAGQHHWAVNE